MKKNGKKLYELARDGITIEREPRPVTVYSLSMISQYQEDPTGNKIMPLSLPSFGLDISSGGGFYVRSLISDLARSLGGRAHMTNLMRVKQVFLYDLYVLLYLISPDSSCESFFILRQEKLIK